MNTKHSMRIRHCRPAGGWFPMLIVALLLAGAEETARAQTTGFNKTSGTHDYNTSGNWVGGAINGIWDSSLTIDGALNVTFNASSVLSSGWAFN